MQLWIQKLLFKLCLQILILSLKKYNIYKLKKYPNYWKYVPYHEIYGAWIIIIKSTNFLVYSIFLWQTKIWNIWVDRKVQIAIWIYSV